ncbi:urease accessory protein UreE [Neiella marina]|uniref:Urease accessory protein UreE n=1 Tax=Neiella marina TaxID=508461 RepID=A0A8J2U4U4_9GAMM|nr:urease accessory protein UreE [Neiella marina]GGA76276.1 urease accessory protein UreE [Neiella marina]
MYKLISKSDHCHGKVLDIVSLPFETRQRGRFKAATVTGKEVGVFLTRGEVLREGDYLTSECGENFLVKAEPEQLSQAKAADWLTFAKACYHLGNRHTPLQVGEMWVRFQPDHVLEQMVELLGLTVSTVHAGFDPENGAYAQGLGGHSHGHDHGHSHSHEHAHHEHEHA